MKILVVQESDWLSRGPHDQHHLLEKLSLKEDEVTVIDFEVGWKNITGRNLISQREIHNDHSKIYPGSRIRIVRPGIIRLPLLDYLSLSVTHYLEIKRQMKVFHPDVVIGLGIINGYIAARIARGSSTPFVYYWLDVLHSLIPFRAFRNLGKMVEKRTLRNSNLVITTNKALSEIVISMGAPSNQVVTLGHGIDLKMFNPKGLDQVQIRKQYNLAANDKVMIYVGRLTRVTGVLDIVEEFSWINDPHVKLVIVGGGSRENELRTLTRTLGISDRVLVLGRRPYSEIPDLIMASDICLLPFHDTEMMRHIVPLKLFDYLSMGKPVVSTKLRGVEAEFGHDSGIYYAECPGHTILKAMELFEAKDFGSNTELCAGSVAGCDWDSRVEQLRGFLGAVVQNNVNGYD